MDKKFNITTEDKTVLGYLECYDGLELEEIISLEQVFSMLKDHELEDANYVDDGYVKPGIKIKKKAKRYRANNLVEFDNGMKLYNTSDKHSIYFLRSLVTLLSVTPYLSSEDRINLNTLFDGFNRLNKGIGEIIEYSGELYLPIYNYKKKTLK